MNAEQPLMTPFSIGDLTLKNRVVLAPMTRSRAGKERVANELMAEYYVQRANAGLILTEATVISEQGIGWVDSPGIYNDDHVNGWKIVTDAVHKENTPIFVQLWHCGRASHTDFHPELGLPVAPSAIKIEGDHIHTPAGKKEYEIPRALETSEVESVVQDYIKAAERAKAAGFDGVEVHGANGYLIDEFLQSKTNTRTDRYGGSIENRFQFLKEIVEGVIKVFPANRVGVRISPNGAFNDMGSPDFREQYLYVAKQLDAYGLSYLHVMDGLAFGFHELGEPMELKEFRGVFSGPLMGNCGYTQELGNEKVGSGEADLIAYGRPYISNPDLAVRFQKNMPLADDADQSVWYDHTAGAEGYTTFPSAA